MSAADGDRITVLLVDDHRVFVQGLEKVLSDAPDVDVVGSASSVADAVEAVRLHRPRVVLMDYELSDGTGTRATSLIKADRPETQVVMLTSFTDEAVLVEAIEAGCSGFVTKHKAVEEVTYAVRAAADGEVLIAPAILARLLPRLRRDRQGVRPECTRREIDILKLLAAGLSNPAIADRLGIKHHTVRNHVQNILTKLQAHSKLEAVAVAVREGIIARRSEDPSSGEAPD